MPTRDEMIKAIREQRASQEMSRQELIDSLRREGVGAERILQETYEPLQEDRFLLKNLQGSTDSAGVMEYLQNKHKNSEFKYSEAGDLLGRDKGSKEWKMLDPDMKLTDPSTYEFADVTDVIGDLAQGALEGGAATGAALLAAPTSPAGSLAAGAGAAALTGAAISKGKQELAEYLGLKKSKETDWGNLGLEALSSFHGIFVTACASASNIPSGWNTATIPTTNHSSPTASNITHAYFS